MCADFKATINTNTQFDACPMSTVEEIFGKIGKASHFSKFDLTSAYLQIALNAKTKKLSIIERNTHKDLVLVKPITNGHGKCKRHISKMYGKYTHYVRWKG